VAQAHYALNGFSELFGKRWIERYFGSAKSPLFVLFLTTLWQCWEKVSPLPKSNQIERRWSSGVNDAGAVQEVLVCSHLLEAEATVELFPSSNSHVPDARFRFNTDGWTYVEVSHRSLSESRKWTQKVLLELAEGAAGAIQGRHGNVGVNRQISVDELAAIMTWLQNVDDREQRFDDYAIFHTTDLNTGAGDPMDSSVKFVPDPKMFSTHRKMNGEYAGTAIVVTEDYGAENLLRKEASQLPSGECGVVVLDISGIAHGVAQWEPLIRERLQPTVHTRVAAVVLMETFMGGQNGLVKRGAMIINQYARRPLSDAAIQALESLLQ